MTRTIRQIVAHPLNGHLVALHIDGSIARQYQDPDGGGHVLLWRFVNTDNLPGRAVSITVLYNGKIVALLADNTLHEEIPVEPGAFRRHAAWKSVAAPSVED